MLAWRIRDYPVSNFTVQITEFSLLPSAIWAAKPSATYNATNIEPLMTSCAECG
jgi:hypothetical protein